MGRVVVIVLAAVTTLFGVVLFGVPAAESQSASRGLVATTLTDLVLFGADGKPAASASIGGRSAVAAHPTLPLFYVAVESGPNDGRLLVFRLKGSTFESVGRVRLAGSVSVHVAMSASARFLVVSHFGGQGASIVRLRADGVPDAKSVRRVAGGGGNSKMHAAVVSKDERTVFLTDIARDELVSVQLDNSARVRSNKITVVERGSGPRSLAFLNQGAWLVVSNEYGHSVTCFPVANGALGVGSTVSLGAGEGEPADVLAVGNETVLVADRGPDTLVVVDVAEGDDGTCVPEVRTSFASGGSWPRSLVARPDGGWCIGHDRGGEIICGQSIAPGTLRANTDRVWGLA